MKNKLNKNCNYLTALRFIQDNNLKELEIGKHLIDGENVFVLITDAELKSVQDVKLEAHDKYIDLQIPLEGRESFGIKKRSECTLPQGEMDTENDILFFNDEIEEIVTVEPGEQIMFEPDMAHAPLIGTGRTHKAIFKIKVV